ncbi:YfhD family protein [Paenisporosarcina sp. TG20]|uniref:YfhD family protein n=1 Tax=Paenisporosarcina sp. TG20 TaxID=1211706 RepID=UPI0002EA9EDE|nr:YfhD family protein [Paenisporosarcina sp. TG20]
MGRDDHNSSSNNKNSLPQTPKFLKMSPGKAKEEFSREFQEIINKDVDHEVLSKKNKNKK